MERLIRYFRSGSNVLCITGAGLSAPSGIATYRSAINGVWSKYIVEWGTRRRFLRDPDKWWNEFWLRSHYTSEFLRAQPNAGHEALTALASASSLRVVTQNIDRLHNRSGLQRDLLVEVHGALGQFKCANTKCRYGYDESLQMDLEQYSRSGSALTGDLEITAPHCPECGSYVMPNCLFFDELYDSHSFYRIKEVEQWIRQADVLLFVGTSFSVGITDQAVRSALERRIPMFNMNICIDPSAPNQAIHLIGPCEQLLPQLASAVCDGVQK